MNTSLLQSRQRIEAQIEDLIALLDLLDGDPDVEANGDELDVGMPANWCASRSYAATVREDDEDGADDEFSGDEHEP